MVFETALDVEAVHVVLSGPPKLLEQTRFDLLRAVVDVTGLAPADGPYSLPIRLDYHDRPVDERKRIAITSLEPSVVEVTISNPTSGL